MSSICSNTLLKNSADFIEPCLNSVLPYVDRAIVSVDRTSTDGTIDILERMAGENPKIELDFYTIENPTTDLPRERNRQLKKTKEDWVWIVDDDEYYLPEDVLRLKEIMEREKRYEAIAFRAWFVVDENHHHPSRGRHRMERIFRNKPTLNWRGEWSREAIHDGNRWISSHNMDDTVIDVGTDIKYIHLSYLKKYTWRTAFGKTKFHYPKISEKEINTYPLLPENIKQAVALCLK